MEELQLRPTLPSTPRVSPLSPQSARRSMLLNPPLSSFVGSTHSVSSSSLSVSTTTTPRSTNEHPLDTLNFGGVSRGSGNGGGGGTGTGGTSPSSESGSPHRGSSSLFPTTSTTLYEQKQQQQQQP